MTLCWLMCISGISEAVATGSARCGILVGAAEASRTPGLVERHGTYVRSMVEKMVHDGVPDDTSAQSLFDRATSAKNMMSGIRGYSPSQWVLAMQPRIQSHS